MQPESFHPQRETEPVATPVEDVPQKKKVEVAFVDITHGVEDEIEEIASIKEMGESVSLVKLLKNMLAKDLLGGYTRHKQRLSLRNTINESNNPYVVDGSDSSSNAFKDALITRFTQLNDVEGSLIHKDAGEKQEVISEPEIMEKLRDAIQRYVEADTEDQEQLDRVAKEISEQILSKDHGSHALHHLNNVPQVAQELRTLRLHQEGVARLDYELEIIKGTASIGVRQDIKYGGIEKLVDRVEHSPVNFLVNKEVLGSAVAICSSIFSYLLRVSSVSVLTKTFVGFGWAGSALLAGAEKSKQMKDLRNIYMRRRAEGEDTKELGSSVSDMEQFSYQLRSAEDLKTGLSSTFYEQDGQTFKESLNEQNELREALLVLAEVEARIRISDRRRIDLIQYSHIDKIEEERTALDILRLKIKTDLKKLRPTSFNENDIIPFLDSRTELLATSLIGKRNGADPQSIAQRDAQFNRMRYKESAKSGVTGMFFSQVIGSIVSKAFVGVIGQRIVAVAGNGLKEVALRASEYVGENVGESVSDFSREAVPYSALNAKNELVKKIPNTERIFTLVSHPQQLLQMDKNVLIAENHSGQYDLIVQDKIICSDLVFDSKTGLTAESRKKLIEHSVPFCEQTIAIKDDESDDKSNHYLLTTIAAPLNQAGEVPNHPNGIQDINSLLSKNPDGILESPLTPKEIRTQAGLPADLPRDAFISQLANSTS
jgi:hypothetical protein